MSGNKYLLDTNAILYILDGDETLADFLFEEELYVSVISEMELLSYKNIADNEKKEIEAFLEDCTIINIDNKIKLQSIEVKKLQI
ncbi:PIN domain-containing protein [Mucilaginibacter sp.]|uniref:PIN domain-containing protein n=1 Tax=Mucilaginibacter sp. TaxID=1882438 RepID=UPI002618FEE1|nr:PIN domain-containing protein [Mucilaginibacter sp.]MDB4921701.1 type toxin-antitoxin system VapC family toxin [Mucilaginibacter sp.]